MGTNKPQYIDFDELEDYAVDPWAMAKDSGINILSDKEFRAGYIVNGEIVAALFDSIDRDEYSFDIAVSKQYQRKGLGADLMDTALDIFEDNAEAFGDDYELKLDVVSPVAKRMLKKRGLFEVSIGGGHTIMVMGSKAKMASRIAHLYLLEENEWV